jgi:CubicO group peptidase (beta-lactamase class C family)
MTRAEALRPQLEGFVARMQRETRVPGIGLAVSIRGERIEAHAGTRTAGAPLPLAADARYHLGCATKLLLAMAALELKHCGLLDLDAAIGEYLTELRGTAHGRGVRVAHLLSHTSGYRGTNLLDDTARIERWDDLVAYLANAPQLFPPGAVFSYEHTESLLLAEILRRSTRHDSLDHIAELYLAPLGIEPGRLGAGSDPRDAGRHRFDVAAASFVPIESAPAMTEFWLPAFSEFTVTATDLLSVAEAALHGSAGLLADATVAALATTVVRLPPTAGGPLSELLPVAFGLGTGELRDGCRGNTGISAGQCVGLRFDAREGVAIAVALNAAAPHVRDFILGTVAAELVRRPPPRAAGPFELDFAELGGTYVGPGGGIVRVRCDGGRLVCEIGREHKTHTVRVELSLDTHGRLTLRSPVPQLSIGFFSEPHSGALGLMLGLSAYRRLGSGAGR